MTDSDTVDNVTEGIAWLAKNKGFISLVLGFGGVIMSIIGTCIVIMLWANSVIDGFQGQITRLDKQIMQCNHRIELSETRLCNLEHLIEKELTK